MAEHRAHRAVDVADRHVQGDPLAALEGGPGLLDQRDVQLGVQAVVLADDRVQRLVGRNPVQDRRQVDDAGLPDLGALGQVP